MSSPLRGFTLIELLVVIAILALLAGLLFPVIARAKDKGRRTQCVAGMRNVGQAIQMYLNDNDELFPSDRIVKFEGNPVAVNPRDSDQAENSENEGGLELDEANLLPWYERVRPYFKVDSQLLCPDDLGRKVALQIPGGDVKDTLRVNSFGTNRWFEFDSTYLKFPTRPADTILLAEVMGRKRLLLWPPAPQYTYEVLEMDIPWWQWPRELNWPLREGVLPRAVAARDLAMDRHNGGSHYLYVDGHVKWAKFEQVWGNAQQTNQFWPTR